MVEEAKEGDKQAQIPQQWKALCDDMTSTFSTIFVEGSDTMMLVPKAPPVVDHSSLLFNFDLKKYLAQKLVNRWGDEGRVGAQSFRELDEEEQVTESYIPPGWNGVRQKWGEAVVPLVNVKEAVGVSRCSAYRVKRRRMEEVA